MTPEEKGQDLFGEMKGGCCQCPRDSKEAALTCCDEVIAEIEDLQQNCVMEFPMALEYWQKVKAHIQSL